MYLLIKSKDKFEIEYEKSFIFQKVVSDNKAEYSYSDEHGESRILLYENHVEIYRKGEINTKQTFKLGEVTSFFYLTKEFKKKLFINTRLLDINTKKIFLEYDILDNNVILNSIRLEIIELKGRNNYYE